VFTDHKNEREEMQIKISQHATPEGKNTPDKFVKLRIQEYVNCTG
jgi:glutamate synthase domain-containing protein 2